MKFFKSLQIFLIAILIIGIAIPLSTEAATVNSGDLMKINKTVSNSTLVKGETTDVTLTVKGTPQDSTFVKPNDVVLIIDKSGSMQADNRLNAAKDAAKEFIDLMDLTKHELGIVDYSDRASSFPLTTDKTAAKAYVDTIQLGGGTNTSDAIRAATTMLANKRPTAQPTIVIMTDGAANSAPDALAAAKAAKDAGITFYSIALLGPNENPNTSAPNNLLKEMASSFDHHHFVLGSVGLSDVYKAIVEEIGLASAYNVTITDTISPEFELVPGSYDHHIPKPTVTGNTIEWFISELKTNELSFTYQVRAKADATAGKYSVAQTSSTFEIGDSSTYSLNTTNPIVEIKNHPPIITSIKEDKGLTTGGETVTITGQNFLPGAKVLFGANQSTIISENATEIVVTTPVGAQGPVVVKVQNSDGQFALGEFNYYAIPTLDYVTPSEGNMDGGNKVSVIGSNFMSGAKVYFNDIEAATDFSTKSKLYSTVPTSTVSGPVKVKVVNPDGTTIEKSDAYTYLTPPPPPKLELTSVSATSGKIEGGEQTYLIGKNFDPKVKIFFGNEEAVVNSYINNSKIRVNVPAAATAGIVSVKAENPDGSVSILTDAYEYLTPPPLPAPEISYLSETSILTNVEKTIYLFGKNISPSSQVFIGDQEAKMSFVTNSKVRIAIPANSNPMTVDVKLVNPDGQVAVLVNGFSYIEPVKKPAPSIVSLSSTSGSMGGGETVTITGQNFERNANVYFGDKLAVKVSISETEIVVKTPISATSGPVAVKVVNPDLQEAIVNDAYHYQGLQITITSLATTSGSIKGGNLVVVYGTNFNSKMTVTVDGNVVPYTYLATNRIRIKMPSVTTAGVVKIAINSDGSNVSIDYTYN
ncbi:IPT/TIG domain-containing protein [Psychrobacillus psychrodurans]|uniref:IPT/TIG domain-containing protein n=1 Tax=Psychrobacillus psychrodurans TaxID=126157 RepID=UPI001F4E4F06|nr:IPT/TIG domain-containing protein [Psychrobacillus psychrodurans]MCK1995976.1 IPT/TIG domain-containing protein [Psychrobacillus psychrodurans]